MSLQLIIVLMAMALAAVYVLRATFLTWFGKTSGCAGGCGKCRTPETAGTGPMPERVNGRISLLQ